MEITEKHLDVIKTFINEGVKLERDRILKELNANGKESLLKSEITKIVNGE